MWTGDKMNLKIIVSIIIICIIINVISGVYCILNNSVEEEEINSLDKQGGGEKDE